MSAYRTSLAVVNCLNLDSFPAHSRVVMKVSWIRSSLYRQVISAVIGGGGGTAQHTLPANQNAPVKVYTITRNLNLFVW